MDKVQILYEFEGLIDEVVSLKSSLNELENKVSLMDSKISIPPKQDKVATNSYIVTGEGKVLYATSTYTDAFSFTKSSYYPEFKLKIYKLQP